MGRAEPEFSIIIMNMNTCDNLKIQLPVLTSFKKVATEIILVDNASSDESVSFVKNTYPQIKVIALKKNVGTYAMNVGFQQCRGKFVLYIGDMVLSEKMLLRLRKVIDKDSSVFMAVPRIINYFSKKPEFAGEIISRSFYSVARKRVTHSLLPIEILSAGCGMFRRESIRQVGGIIYDPDYFLYGEDVDLGVRIRLAGKRAVLVPDAVIEHAHLPITLRTFSRFHLRFLTERNLLVTFLRSFTWDNTVLWSSYAFGMRLLSAAKDVVKGDFNTAAARLYAWLWVAIHPAFVWRKRCFSQKLRRASDSYVMKPFCEKDFFKAFLFGVK
ncbi:glycosyltransferase family 2 protein [Candidatus Woesearchaeota archaeon]|nr:glycosyltransferase family 2 protein [Candidatus Woesearchaeota archaeon]